MTDLKGHAVPGSIFLVYGLWIAICCLRRDLKCRKTGVKYISTATFLCPWPCGRLGSWPLESIAKICASSFGVFGEIYFGLPNITIDYFQHAMMYFFFLMAGIVELAMHFRVSFPSGMDYMAMGFAFLIEGLMNVSHLKDRDLLGVSIHMLLVYVMFLTAVVYALEAKFQRSVLLTLSRSYLLILQGSWWWGMGIIQNGPNKKSWDVESHMDVMYATIYFCCHCAANFIILCVMAVIMNHCFTCHRTQNGPFQNGSDLPMTRLEDGNGNKQDGYRLLDALKDEDSDSEMELEKAVVKQA